MIETVKASNISSGPLQKRVLLLLCAILPLAGDLEHMEQEPAPGTIETASQGLNQQLSVLEQTDNWTDHTRAGQMPISGIDVLLWGGERWSVTWHTQENLNCGLHQKVG